MDIVLIRHTRCAAEAGLCYGHLDVPLSATSSAEIASALERTPQIDIVFSSPSQRCLKLAQALASREDIDVRVMEELRELHFGQWEGRRWSEIARTESDSWSEDPWHRAPPGGERELDLFARTARAYAAILESEKARVAVVAHAGPLRLLRCLLLDEPIARRWNWTPELGGVEAVSIATRSG